MLVVEIGSLGPFWDLWSSSLPPVAYIAPAKSKIANKCKIYEWVFFFLLLRVEEINRKVAQGTEMISIF